ncbi:MAG: proton-conducting transporter membrane subunit [Bacteroidales bacterium]|nr:proton-conducting transporter membrane subunit [Bacteroidales bacterium]
MSELHYIISLPILAGIILFFLPEKFMKFKGIVSTIVAAIALYCAIMVYQMSNQLIGLNLGQEFFNPETGIYNLLNSFTGFTTMNLDNLSKLVLLFAAFFALLILAYSIVYISVRKMPRYYYPFFLITMGCAAGAILADNLLLFVFFWGVLGFTLYMLIKGNTDASSAAAKKTFILIGASDGIMILGLALLWKMNYTLQISAISVPTVNALQVCAFICLLIGAFTKAGAFPFHTWVPDYAQHAPASSSAYLPASLDKLLGIYFLARICNDMFILNQWLTLTMLIIGVLTIIIAVLMALIQHNYKRLLGYHAVSQVGYMITGLALGTPLGIAGGLFHMINHALYKSGLFLTAGSIDRMTGKENIEDLGGLSKAMPLTFFAALVFALSISGIPPFNGFASKWLIYQGIIEFGSQPGIANQLWIVWLGLAVFGSALTLASFIKFISGIFWGRIKETYQSLRKTSPLLWLPPMIIAFLCIGFGVFASSWVIPKLIMPITGNFEYIGFWDSSFVSLLVFISIVLGGLVYLAGNIRKIRVEDNFILGEKQIRDTGFSALEYYKTISQAGFFAAIYRKAEKKWFDIYDISKDIVLGFSKSLSAAHSGILPVYAIWIIAGLLIMMIIFI